MSVRKGGTLVGTGGDPRVNDISLKDTGFVDRSETTLSFDDVTRTLTITKVGASYAYYIQGTKFTKVANDSVAFADTEGTWFIYYNGGTLTASQTPWTIGAVAPVSVVEWDAASNKRVRFLDERHTIGMPNATHNLLHKTVGARYEPDGGGALAYTPGPGSADADAQFSLTNFTIFDEDIEGLIEHNAAPSAPFEQILTPIAKLPGLRLDAATADVREKVANNFSCWEGPGAGNDRLQWNEFTGGAWQLTEVTDNWYVNCWVCASLDNDEPCFFILGQAEYQFLTLAEDEDITDLDLAAFGMPEVKVLYRVTFRTKDTFANTPKAFIAAVADYRTSSPLPGGVPTTVSHATTSGRDAANQHPEEAIKPGRQRMSPEFAGAVIIRPGSNEDVDFSADHDAANNHNLYRGESANATLQSSSVIQKVMVPAGFQAFSTNAFRYWNRVDSTPGNTGLTVKIYDTGGTLRHTDTKQANTSWTLTDISDTDLAAGTFTPGAEMKIEYLFEAQNEKGAELSDIDIGWDG
jgi:hypothetical protein